MVFQTVLRLTICTLICTTPLCAEETISGKVFGKDGTMHVPAFDLPLSDLLSDETRAAIAEAAQESAKFKCPGGRFRGGSREETLTYRKCYHEQIYPRLIEALRQKYPIDIQPETIGGVYTEVFTPIAGISDRNKDRVLINLHGGGFMMGGRVGGQLESIGVAAIGKIKVISVDYRMYPEYRFPAATDDVIAVYKELLKTYKPENIGVYGHSAGGALTAQTLARIQVEGLPNPGAAGMFGGGGCFSGDSTRAALGAIAGVDIRNISDDRAYMMDYFAEADPKDPLVQPARHPEILKKFPPSLFISSTRDWGLSGVVYTHSQLIKYGIEAELFMQEGLEHGGYYNPDISEFLEAHNVIIKFFDRHLGK